MSEVKFVGQTYNEYLKEVRARQFGWDISEPTSITEDTLVKPTKKSKKQKGTDE